MGVMTVRNLRVVREAGADRLDVEEAGEVTVTVAEMPRAELMDGWSWMFDNFNPGVHPDINRLAMRGFTVHHDTAAVLGIMIQNVGNRLHVEWFDPGQGDFLYAGQAQRPRHGVAYILDARQRHGHSVPADPVPISVPAPAPLAPVLLAPLHPGTVARYQGSLAALRGELVRAYFCDCEEDNCDGYQLEPLRRDQQGAVHVRRSSLVEEAA